MHKAKTMDGLQYLIISGRTPWPCVTAKLWG